MNVTLKDFQPINTWTPYQEGPKFACCEKHKKQPKFIIDETTGRTYLNESRGLVRFKCILLTFGIPFVHPITSLLNIAYRIVKLVTLSHFWKKKDGEANYNFKARVIDAGMDLLRIIATPVAVVGLELASIYGWFRPYDGRKLYASGERALYGNFVLAPCFQPDPKCHAFGGNINQKDVF